jgi:DNA repair exonuclease SbcCD ATPase subunit
MFEKISEDNQNLQKKISENNQKLADCQGSIEKKMSDVQESNKQLQENLDKKLSETNQKIAETNQKLSETNQKMSESYGNLEKKLDETNQKLSEMEESNHNFYMNLETKLDEFNLNIEKKLSENYVSEFGVGIKGKNENEFRSVVESKLEQNVEDITAVTDGISRKGTGVEVELNDKFEKPAEEVEGEVNKMVQKVQVEYDNCTEENLKQQGERVEPLNIKNKDLQSKSDETLNKSQVNDVTLIQDTSRNVEISPTQADYGVIIESTNENTCNCKNIYLFRKYAYTLRTDRMDITVYEKDRSISNNKVTKYKKYRKLEWCINVKKEVV